MDRQFDKLNSWLLFELIVTVLSLLLVFFLGSETVRLNRTLPYGEMGYAWLGGMLLLILRIFFLGRARLSLIPDDEDVTRSKYEPKVIKKDN